MRQQLKWSLVAAAMFALVAAPAVFAFNPNSDASLVGWWPMNEGSGTSVADFSGNGNDGDFEGSPTWTTGYMKNALSFDGSDDSVNFGDSEDFDLTEAVTLAIWVNTEDVGTSEHNPWLGKGDYAYAIKLYTSDGVQFFVYDGSWYSCNSDALDESYNGEWHHMAGTYDGAVLRTFIDGEEVQTTDHEGGIATSSADVTLGVNSDHTDRRSAGILDDARIYSRALTAEEIQQVMLGGGNAALASVPSPADGEDDVALDASLSWTAGVYAASHDVYLGTSFDDVNDADRTSDLLVSEGQSETTFTPDELVLDGVYYWRVDEVNANPSELHKGTVWTFLAEPTAFKTAPVDAIASSSRGDDYDPNNTINESGLDELDQHSTEETEMWQSGDGEMAGAWIQYEFDAAVTLDSIIIWNANPAYESFLGFGMKEVTIETSLDGEVWDDLAGTVTLNRASGTPTYVADNIILGNNTVAKYVKIVCVSSYSSSPMVTRTGLSEVRFMTIPAAARRPEPSSGSDLDSIFETLTWRAGRGAEQHEIYVDTNEALVAAADSSVLVETSSEPSYDLSDADLLYDETYFCQVVEIAGDIVTAGPIWDFNTPEYLVVDDMESYSEDVNIFQVWVDGLEEGDENNGSMVGHDQPPYVDQEIAFGDTDQSLPFYYENTGSADVSTATRDLEGQDWAAGGLQVLVLYFLGEVDNDEATFFVEIDGKRIESPESLQIPVWKQMEIDLDDLGINLNSVDSFTLGVDGSGSGMLLIDEIRVCREVDTVETPSDPGDDGLVVHYDMEDNVENQAGSKYDGIETFTLIYSSDSVNDDFGKCAIFNGTDNDVNIPDLGDLISTLTASSYSAWVSIDAEADGSWMRVFDFGTGIENYMFLTPRAGTSDGVRGAILSQAMTDAEINEVGVTSGKALVDGWHHVAMVIEDGDPNGLLTLYVDGWSAGSVETPAMPEDLGETNLNWLGESQWDGDSYYNGLMDEFRIYNRALSEGEIRYLAGDR